MKVQPTRLPDVLVIEPQVFSDERGYFLEAWHEQRLRSVGIDERFVQDNHSQSARDVLRGLHYQLCHPQGKLVRVVTGSIFDVAVDLRRGSPTFGQWTGVTLSEENHRMLWIPRGFAHGFYTLDGPVHLLYKCTDYYAPEDERCIVWNDPDLAVSWPIPQGRAPIVGAKDLRGTRFCEAMYFP